MKFDKFMKDIKVIPKKKEECERQNECLFNYLRDKTSGKKLTLASWIRKFVQSHAAYKKDSIVSKVLF